MTRERHWFPPAAVVARRIAVLVALTIPDPAPAQVIRLGNELQVNSSTVDKQVSPSIALDADGDFVVSWQSIVIGSFQSGVFARRFSSAGAAQASEFEINTYTTGLKGTPSVGVDAAGRFVIAWVSIGQESPGLTGAGVFARRFSSAGAPLTGEFQVNTFTLKRQSSPSVAVDLDGDFVVAWQSYMSESVYGIFGRRFSSSGTALAGEFQINSYTLGAQVGRTSPLFYPSASVDADGDFVVAWANTAQDGSGSGIFARRFSSAGAPLATEFQVNAYTPNYQDNPGVASDADGDFVVAWNSYGQDGALDGVFARRFSSAGVAQAGEFRVNGLTASAERNPSVAMADDGAFVVAWERYQVVSSAYDTFARRFSATGIAIATEFLVNSYTTNHQYHPVVAADTDGDFVVAWESVLQDGGSYGIFAQRFAPARALDIDGNGLTQPLTDGVLVVRRFFGFSGTNLTSSAVGAGCTRCDAAAIEPYIAGLGLILDIDGNSTTGALSDGLLALRYLFGFRGDTLTNGVIGGGCARCDAAAIEPYLAGLTG